MSSMIAQSVANRGHESEFHGSTLGLLKLYRIEYSSKAIHKWVDSLLITSSHLFPQRSTKFSHTNNWWINLLFDLPSLHIGSCWSTEANLTRRIQCNFWYCCFFYESNDHLIALSGGWRKSLSTDLFGRSFNWIPLRKTRGQFLEPTHLVGGRNASFETMQIHQTTRVAEVSSLSLHSTSTFPPSSCELNLKLSGMMKYFESSTSTRNRIRIPLTESSKKEMLSEMKKAKKVIGMEVENSRGWIYVLPHGDCRAMNPSSWAATSSSRPILHSSLIVDYLCLCTNPPVEGGIKGVEQQLEVLMTPSLSAVNWFSLVPDRNLRSHSLDPQRQPEVNILASYDAEVILHLSRSILITSEDPQWIEELCWTSVWGIRHRASGYLQSSRCRSRCSRRAVEVNTNTSHLLWLV